MLESYLPALIVGGGGVLTLIAAVVFVVVMVRQKRWPPEGLVEKELGGTVLLNTLGRIGCVAPHSMMAQPPAKRPALCGATFAIHC